LDYEGAILTEYQRYMPRASFAAAWWSYVSKRKGIVYYSGRLTEAQKRTLRGCRLHDDDWKFVGVATKTSDRLLVSEDSDFWDQAAMACLRDDFRLTLLRVAEAEAR
jgi:hypothetical protein